MCLLYLGLAIIQKKCYGTDARSYLPARDYQLSVIQCALMNTIFCSIFQISQKLRRYEFEGAYKDSHELLGSEKCTNKLPDCTSCPTVHCSVLQIAFRYCPLMSLTYAHNIKTSTTLYTGVKDS